MTTYQQATVQVRDDEAAARSEGVSLTVRPASQKAPSAFRTISEVADELGVQQHVLRFWETKFSQIKPLKRGGGRRYYRPEDIALIKKIHHLLYTEGYTIKGAQKFLKTHGRAAVLAESAPDVMASLQDVPSADMQDNAPVTAPRAVNTGVSFRAVADAVEDVTASAEAIVDSVIAAGADETAAAAPRKPRLNERQRAILESMLGELKELRSMIRNEQAE